jgi:hypothetical protein
VGRVTRPMERRAKALTEAWRPELCGCQASRYLTPQTLSIHCRPPPHPEPSARRPYHDALPIDRLPGRATCSPRRPPGPAPRPRKPSFGLLPVPVRRGKGRQVRQQRLCGADDDAGPGCKGRHEVPAAARPDRGSCQLRFPGTPCIEREEHAIRARLTVNWHTEHRETVDAAHCPRIRAPGRRTQRPPLPREPGARGQVPPR